MLSINAVASLAKMYIEYVELDPFNTRSDYFSHTESLRIVLIIAMTFRILENLFMMSYAFQTIIFFLRMKIRNLSMQRKQFSNFNKMIILFLILVLIFRPFVFTTIDSMIITRLIINISNN